MKQKTLDNKKLKNGLRVQCIDKNDTCCLNKIGTMSKVNRKDGKFSVIYDNEDRVFDFYTDEAPAKFTIVKSSSKRKNTTKDFKDLKIGMRIKISKECNISSYYDKIGTISKVNDNGVYIKFDSNSSHEQHWCYKDQYKSSDFIFLSEKKSTLPLLALGLASGLAAKALVSNKATKIAHKVLHEI